MKLEITQSGARIDGKPLVVGSTLEIDGDTIPASLVGKVRVVDQAEKVAVTNPAKAKAE